MTSTEILYLCQNGGPEGKKFFFLQENHSFFIQLAKIFHLIVRRVGSIFC